MPRLRTKFGERAFSHAGPQAWNTLPSENIHHETSPNCFKRQLKDIPVCRACELWTFFRLFNCKQLQYACVLLVVGAVEMIIDDDDDNSETA